MKKRRLLCLAPVSCLGLAGLLFLLSCIGPKLRIDRESFARIEIGMTENEVIAIFGAPGSKNDSEWIWKRVKNRFDVVGVDGSDQDSPVLTFKAWVGDGVAIQIGFDSTGKVRALFYFGFEETRLNNARRYLRLP